MTPFRSALLALAAFAAAGARGDTDDLVRAALAAEARMETRQALALFQEAIAARPADAFLQQKLARQYSDLMVELPTREEQRAAVAQALVHARRAVELEPQRAENVLSVAICLGKLGVLSGVRDKVRYSRELRAETERALTLEPGYAWAHHLLGRWHHEVAELSGTARLVVKLFYGGLPGASHAEAVRHLERAVDLEPEQLKHHLELGLALAGAGQPGPARAAIQRGLAMPSREKHDEAAKARARAVLGTLPSPR
ncbi:MAG: hypothetical protein ACO3JJ_01990 [Opitutaceae bacterium]